MSEFFREYVEKFPRNFFLVDSSERKVLRTICGSKIENGVYKRRHNHELDKEFDNPNVNVTKTNRLRYAGHIIRRPEDVGAEYSIRNTLGILLRNFFYGKKFKLLRSYLRVGFKNYLM
jgi:hypothetical protein